jgi:DNA-binding transcriptional ArsR family regulator
MWELVLSMQMAQARYVPDPFLAWRQTLGERLGAIGTSRRSVAMLCTLVPPTGSFPDFLTPSQLVADLDAGCEAVACTAPTRLAADMAAVFPGGTAPAWARSLACGDRQQIREIVGAVRDCHGLVLAPQWSEVRAAVAFDRAKRARQVVRDGVGAMLASIPGILRWDGRVLHTRYPVSRTVHLGGRGVTLVPSYFCWGNPITWIDSALPPVLVYQAEHPRGGVEPHEHVPPRLVSLLGHTRAHCLRLLLNPLTTTDLAHHLDISVGSASKQATVLREAGLITSTRQGGAVLHDLTALGAALLTGGIPTP